MYDYVKGTLKEKVPSYCVLDVGGLGYLIFIPSSTFGRLPTEGEELLVYTTLIVREDAHLLYGFFTKQERSLFLLLRGVSGIGPKTALALVGHLDLPLFQTAVQDEKPEVLAKVPGIGKKTASRIVVEMRDKLDILNTLRQEASLESVDTISFDAIAALVHLGYAQQAAKKAVEKVRKNHDALGTLIPAALQIL